MEIQKSQNVTAETVTGHKIEITLEQWAEQLIDKALEKHTKSCPVYVLNKERTEAQNDFDKRLEMLETKLKIVQWLMAPFYLGFSGWLVYYVLGKIFI